MFVWVGTSIYYFIFLNISEKCMLTSAYSSQYIYSFVSDKINKAKIDTFNLTLISYVADIPRE